MLATKFIHRIAVVLVVLEMALLCGAPVWAGCDVEVTRALTWYWRPGAEACNAAVDTVSQALAYFGIEGPSLVDKRIQWGVTAAPLLTLSLLESQISGRRVILLSTHGDLDTVSLDGDMSARCPVIPHYRAPGHLPEEPNTMGESHCLTGASAV